MDLTRCKKIIKKIATNHVVVEYTVKDKDGKDMIVRTDEYGNDRIQEEKLIAMEDYEKWDTLSSKEIEANKAEAQKRLDDILVIETELEKKIIKKIKV